MKYKTNESQHNSKVRIVYLHQYYSLKQQKRFEMFTVQRPNCSLDH